MKRKMEERTTKMRIGEKTRENKEKVGRENNEERENQADDDGTAMKREQGEEECKRHHTKFYLSTSRAVTAVR